MAGMSDAALATTQALPFALGSVLADRYEVKDLLGEGGMGAVFRAHDRELDEDVALKLLHPEVAKDQAALTRFRREVKLARRVTHRNVARTFDLGAHAAPGAPALRFLTMELIVGESLAARARQGRVALPEALRVAAEIARGLAAAHAVGVVHRDLKPDNVMLSEERVVITDFGIARVADGAGEAMRTGMVVGTPAYMAPEQLENGLIDGRTDVYALGTILFELLAGRLPFVGDSAISLAAQRITEDAPDVRSLAPALPDGVAELVRGMLARRREERPDAQAALDQIESLRGNQAGVARGVAKLPTLASDTFATLGVARTVAVEALAGGADTSELGATLTSAILDALVEARVGDVTPAATEGSDLVVQGTLHASGDRVRARMRVLGRKGTPVWAGHVDGSRADSLGFEDGVVAVITEAVRAWTSSDPGPADVSMREAYEKAYAEYSGFALPRVRNAIAILEELETKKPGDPRVRTLLSRALIGAWAQLGGRDRAMIARAEELALRALETEPSLANAHHAIAQIRYEDGELAAAVRAEAECLRQDPRNAEAHGSLGHWLCKALHVTEGRRRLDLAARLSPGSTPVAFSRINVLALIGEREAARAVLADMMRRAGPLSGAVLMTRCAVWWNDHALAVEAAELIEGAKAGATWDGAARLMRSLVSGKLDPDAADTLGALSAQGVGPHRRALMNAIAADYYARMGAREDALAAIVAFARLPTTDLLWLDAGPPLAAVRGDPRFAEARAVVAARCADIWGSVGSWPHE
jgi:Flp pilus assembly protein TadD